MQLEPAPQGAAGKRTQPQEVDPTQREVIQQAAVLVNHV